MPKPNFKIDEITLVLIVAVLAMLVSVYDRLNHTAQIEAEKITGIITDEHSISFASNGIVNEDKLQEFKKMDYVSLKNTLNVNNDFCINVVDGHGDLILSKGSSKFNGDGIVCRE